MKKVQVKHITSFIGKVFGAPTAGADGKLALSEEQCAKIRETLGEEVLVEYQKLLAEDPESNVVKEALEVIIEAIDIDRDELKKTANDALAKVSTLEKIVEKLQQSPESMPGATSVHSSAPSSSFKVNHSLRHNSLVAKSMADNVPLAVNMETIDVNELKSEFGTFLSQGNNIPLLRSLYQSFSSHKYFEKVICTTEWRAVRGHITSVVQQFVPKWTEKGKTKFTPITIKNRHHKINYPIVPADVIGSWLQKLYEEDKSIDQMPLVKFIVDTVLLPSIKNDIELFMLGKSKFEDHTNDPENANALNTMDGLETILVADLADGKKKINFLPNAKNLLDETMTDEEVLEYINKFVATLPEIFTQKEMNMFCSLGVLQRYERAYKNKWGANSGTEKHHFGTKVVDFSNITLVNLPCLHNSPILFITPKENMILTVNYNEAPNVINDVQKHDYELRLYGEFWMGVGFAIGEAVFASVPADYNPTLSVDLSNPFGSNGKWVNGGAASTDAGESA